MLQTTGTDLRDSDPDSHRIVSREALRGPPQTLYLTVVLLEISREVHGHGQVGITNRHALEHHHTVGGPVAAEIEADLRVVLDGDQTRGVWLVVDNDFVTVACEPHRGGLRLALAVDRGEEADQVTFEDCCESWNVGEHPEKVGGYTDIVRIVPIVERRARLALRHRLLEPATTAEEATDALVAVHSSDPTSVYLSMWSRIPGFQVGDLEHALYESRSLVRHWAMRRTLWVVTRSLLPSLISSSTDSIGASERRRTIKLIEDGGVAPDGAVWLEEVLPKTIDAIKAGGEVLTRHLSAKVPELEEKIVFTNKTGRVVGTTGMASRALVQLGMESKVVRSRPAGSWVSGQYRWAVIDDWLGEPVVRPDKETASSTLAGHYLKSFGPVTETDLRWWSGWTAAQARLALADAGAVGVTLEEGGIGYLGPDDVDPVQVDRPWVALLPSLDSTTMGWKERHWFLGDYASLLFDRNGNAGPTIWVDGRVVGGWAQRKEGQVVYELLEDVGATARHMIEDRIAQLQVWLGETTVTPRFRSPHDLQLTR